MNRRHLLRGALATGLTATALGALTDTRASLDLALAAENAPAELSDLEAAAETYGYGYHGQAPTRVLANLAGDFARLRPLLDAPQPVAARIRVCRTAGQMAGTQKGPTAGRARGVGGRRPQTRRPRGVSAQTPTGPHLRVRGRGTRKKRDGTRDQGEDRDPRRLRRGGMGDSIRQRQSRPLVDRLCDRSSGHGATASGRARAASDPCGVHAPGGTAVAQPGSSPCSPSFPVFRGVRSLLREGRRV